MRKYMHIVFGVLALVSFSFADLHWTEPVELGPWPLDVIVLGEDSLMIAWGESTGVIVIYWTELGVTSVETLFSGLDTPTDFYNAKLIQLSSDRIWVLGISESYSMAAYTDGGEWVEFDTLYGPTCWELGETPDGNILVFSGLDLLGLIYVTSFIDGEWTSPDYIGAYGHSLFSRTFSDSIVHWFFTWVLEDTFDISSINSIFMKITYQDGVWGEVDTISILPFEIHSFFQGYDNKWYAAHPIYEDSVIMTILTGTTREEYEVDTLDISISDDTFWEEVFSMDDFGNVWASWHHPVEYHVSSFTWITRENVDGWMRIDSFHQTSTVEVAKLIFLSDSIYPSYIIWRSCGIIYGAKGIPMRITEPDIQNTDNFELFIYPNPFNSSVYINGPPWTTFGIYDLNGRCVVAKDGYNLNYPYIWQPDKSLGSNMYLVRATLGTKVFIKRITYIK